MSAKRLIPWLKHQMEKTMYRRAWVSRVMGIYLVVGALGSLQCLEATTRSELLPGRIEISAAEPIETTDPDNGDLRGSTVDLWVFGIGGQMTSVAGDTLNTSSGQPFAATLSSESYVLVGGFWPARGRSVLFRDSFESGDTAAWTGVVP